MTAAIAGFALGFSLILAIGAQNAFVLKQGLAKRHVLLVCLICATSDALLIAAGVLGFGVIVGQFPLIADVARYGGAAFLFIYGLMNFYSALLRSHKLMPDGEEPLDAMHTAAICLAFTWLNPHVYLDTIVLLGSVSTQYPGEGLQFAIGASIASFVFFFSLGYGARLLTPCFKKPMAWKILECIIGVVMLAIAVSLVL